MRRLASTLIAATLVALFLPGGHPAGALGAPVPDTLIDFEQDPAGVYPNGFTSVDSPLVHFSSVGQSTINAQFAEGVGEGDISLFVNFGPGSIRMVLDRPTNRISMRFGNDGATVTEPGDEAVLTLFRGTTQVGQSRVTMNRNGLMDQTISFGNGPLFNRATFAFDSPEHTNTQEVIDHIVIGPLCTIAGTEAGETLVGTPGNDVICGGGGNDTIFGRAGKDHITGGNGADTLNGEDGEDFIAGNFGNDTIHGGNQNDRVEGGEQNDKVFGDSGNDFVSGGPGTDQCNGGPGTDTRTSCETAAGFP